MGWGDVGLAHSRRIRSNARTRCAAWRAHCRSGPLDNPKVAHPMKHAYPRPQLHRADWCCLNGPWRFAFDDEAIWRSPRDVVDWPLRIEVPYPPECEASGIADTGFHRAFWYQRDFSCTSDGRRVLLRFGAVDFAARVWVNDQLVATHEGGHTPFMADITDQLSPTGQQVVTVAVHDDQHNTTQPRGKHDAARRGA